MLYSLFNTVAALYLGALIIYILWVRLHWSRPWWLQAFSTISPWAFAPTLVLPALAVLMRSPLFCLLSIAAASIFAYQFLRPMFPHHEIARRVEPAHLKAMTANLLKINTRQVGKIIGAIIAESPDVVALQELKAEHAQAIDTLLADAYPHRLLSPGKDSEGMGLLSRYPFLDSAEHIVAPGANPTQTARIEINGRSVWMVNSHPRIPDLHLCHQAGVRYPCGLSTTKRRADVEGIIQLAQRLGGDAILLGDFNLTDQCEEYGLLTAQWADAYRVAGKGPGLTYPVGRPFFGLHSPFPLFRIDYLFYPPTWRPLRAHTGAMPGSDHRYLVVELA